MRMQILRSGGEIHFETRVDSFIVTKGKLAGVETNTGKSFYGPLILATGHSARDIYTYLHQQNILLEAKGTAVGVRLEHPQELIDQLMYHRKESRGEYLPAAEYSFVTQVEKRGVYSFCMCPGGFVVPAASAPRQVVMNGMSPSNRGSRWANAGIVVEVHPEDFPEFAPHKELAMMKFQEWIEEQAWKHGGMNLSAPAQRMSDFVFRRTSADLPESSYTGGLTISPLDVWLPAFISSRLREGLRHFGRSSNGFLSNEALLIGVETRTSSPVRILRDKDTYQHVTLPGLFPCGEGAGYAGGIVSAAVDGERCAEAVSLSMQSV
jgi:uncharacterized FAD-dependent dehydrogenase